MSGNEQNDPVFLTGYDAQVIDKYGIPAYVELRNAFLADAGQIASSSFELEYAADACLRVVDQLGWTPPAGPAWPGPGWYGLSGPEAPNGDRLPLTLQWFDEGTNRPPEGWTRWSKQRNAGGGW